MASINGILDTGRSAILAHQGAISTTSRNTANVNTPGYHRRDVVLSNIKSLPGVQVEERRRSSDAYLGRKILEAHGALGSAEAQAPSLGAVQQLFADRDGGLGTSVDAFFNALRALEASPMNLDLRRDVASTGTTMADQISATAQSLALERRQADRIVDGMIARVNELTATIADLNHQIANTPQEADGLYDQRQLMANELASYIDVHTFIREPGQMVVLFADGMNLVDKDFAATLTATPDPAYSDMRRVDFTGNGGNPVDVTDRLESGQLGGVVKLRDQVITTLIDRIDQYAYDFITEFNTRHQAGFGTDGATGRDFFDPPLTGVSDAASGMSVMTGISTNPAWIAASSSAAEAVGGNGNIANLQVLERQPLAAGGTRSFVEEMADMLGTVGRIVQSNERDRQSATVELEQLESLHSSQVGVAIDEEMIDLTRFQRGYQAGARIVTTVDEMYQTILGM
ncbi:MAG: flagellar hook-associated protein FlgK [Myxococcales bacterium FL481]|nr:MAG: flagellar hook-associated protein FlgK [Myxococcales bacterium FL481]